MPSLLKTPLQKSALVVAGSWANSVPATPPRARRLLLDDANKCLRVEVGVDRPLIIFRPVEDAISKVLAKLGLELGRMNIIVNFVVESGPSRNLRVAADGVAEPGGRP